MKQTNKFVEGEKVIISITGEIGTIKKFSYVPNMKKYSYTIKEKPSTFYFEDEMAKL